MVDPRVASVLVAALAFSGSLGLIPQGTRQGGVAPEGATTAVLLGRVIDADTGEPIAEASVSLSGRPSPARGRSAPPPASASLFDLMASRGGGSERVVAASNGRFVFRDLPVSTYSVRAEAPGYVADTAAFQAATGVASVEIQSGQTSARVALRLRKQAVITGVVLDEAGEPLIGASVRAYRRVVSRLGTLSYDPPDSATADDRGEYRLSRLEPGDYVVLVPQSQSTAPAAAADTLLQGLLSGQLPEGGIDALGRGGASPVDPRAIRVGEWRVSSVNVPPPASSGASVLAYRTVFHSSALTPAEATWLSLRSGEERGGVNFALQPVATGRINGVVTGSGTLGGVPVRLVPAGGRLIGDPSALDVATAQTQPDGTFVMLAVPPGQYRVMARRDPPQDLSANLSEEMASNPMFQMVMNMQRGQARAPLFGETTVTLGAGATADVSIAATEGVTLSGRLEFPDGQAPLAAEISRARVVLRPLDAAFTSLRTVRPAADGTFTAAGVLPGRYGLNVTLPGAPWFVRQASAAGRNASTAALVVEGRPVDDVVISMTRTVGTLRGTVRRESGAGRDARGGSPPPLVAVAVPANFMDWTDFELLVDRVQFMTVAEDGAFRLGPMLPGEYLMAVVEETQVDPGRGLALLQALAGQATRVTVAAGDGNTVSLGVARLPR